MVQDRLTVRFSLVEVWEGMEVWEGVDIEANTKIRGSKYKITYVHPQI